MDISTASLGQAPQQICAEGGGVRVVRARQLAAGKVRIEAELEHRWEVRLAADGRQRTVALEFLTESLEPKVAPASGEPRRPLPNSVTLAQVAPRTPVSSGVSRITAMVLSQSATSTDLEIHATGPIRPKWGTLTGSNPRFYVDLHGSRLALPGLPASPTLECPVRGVRASQTSDSPALCRVVLDLKPGNTAQVVSGAGTNLLRVTVRGPAERANLALASRGGSPIRPAEGAQQVAVGRKATIALDPGHGGLDSGAVNTALGLTEKEVTLDIAQRARGLLEKAGYRVVMSRIGDRRLAPPQRIEWLQGLEADLLVSIHCDSIDERDDLDGTTSYFRAGNDSSRSLASTVHGSLIETTGASDRGVRPDTSRYDSGFYLLRNARQPAILVETGYISHPETARRFNDPDYRQQIARGIASGIIAHLKRDSSREAAR